MSANRPAVTEEGIMLSPFTQDCTEWLQHCFECLERGEDILSDPFYQPRRAISDASVDNLIQALDEEFDKEMDGFPAYHFRRSGANKKTEWHRLSARNRRALVEGLHRILEEHEDYEAASRVVPPPGPSTGPDYSGGGC